MRPTLQPCCQVTTAILKDSVYYGNNTLVAYCYNIVVYYTLRQYDMRRLLVYVAYVG